MTDIEVISPPMTDIATISTGELHDLALTLAAHDQRARHWTLLAQIIGRVETERLFEMEEFGAHVSLRAWALDTLGLGSGDVGLLRRLYTMMVEYAGAIQFKHWQEVGKGKAEVLLRVHKMGADSGIMKEWFDLALTMTTTALEDRYKEQAGEDVWVEYTMSLPRETAALWDAALTCRLTDAMDQPGSDPKIIYDKAVQHKLVELIATEVIQQYGASRA
jgi:hypothetical protein